MNSNAFLEIVFGCWSLVSRIVFQVYFIKLNSDDYLFNENIHILNVIKEINIFTHIFR